MHKKEKRIQIIADDRERNSNVIQMLKDTEEVIVHIERLSIGDYCADNLLVFERKTLKDFASSIIDGRLFGQMTRLAKSTFKGLMILEGTGTDLAEIGVRREAMQGALITISLILGIPILRSKEAYETAKLIIYATRQVESMAGSGFYRHGYQPKDKRKKQVFILQGLPGVGRERAIRLLDRFGTVEGVISASNKELESVEGIGKGIARKIRWAVNEPTRPYSVQEVFPI